MHITQDSRAQPPHKVVRLWHRERGIVALGYALFFLGGLGFALLYRIDRSRYLGALAEDHWVEWTTVVMLCLAASLALSNALVIHGAALTRAGFAALALFLAFCALEEISWGQRVLDIETPEYFLKHNEQGETNLHNLLHRWSDLRTKHIAAAALFGYGVMLPLLLRARSLREKIPVCLLPLLPLIPPASLVPGFACGILLMVDWPTGMEEELGELCFAVSFVLVMARARLLLAWWPGN